MSSSAVSPRVKEIESRVIALWTACRSTLSANTDSLLELRDLMWVYADALQREGDPRGELVALDLDQVRVGRVVHAGSSLLRRG